VPIAGEIEIGQVREREQGGGTRARDCGSTDLRSAAAPPAEDLGCGDLGAALLAAVRIAAGAREPPLVESEAPGTRAHAHAAPTLIPQAGACREVSD
jgi:hypothetical protein